MMRSNKPIIVGAIGFLGLLIVYFGILSGFQSFNHALKQFLAMWYWILILATGFGIQLGLYSYIRSNIRKRVTGAAAEVTAAGGISTGSMIACCGHHITDVLPIIGLSGAAVFLAKYQLPFILLGIFSNLVGITIMLNIIQKNKLYSKRNFLKAIFSYDMKTIRRIVVVLSLVIVAFSFFSASCRRTSSTPVEEPPPTKESAPTKEKGGKSNLPTKTNDENSVTIEVKPIDLSVGKPAKFDVAITTHQGSLDFDLTKISFLEDDKGNLYQAVSWEGSPPGGHHRSGTLSFPKFKEKTKFIKLTIKKVNNVPERVFEWNL